MKAMGERVKTDVRLSPRVSKDLDTLAVELGIPKNAIITMAICRMSAELAPVLGGPKKRGKILDNLQDSFSEALKAARKV